MHIFYSDTLTSSSQHTQHPVCATIGYFDGVHAGHRFLISQVSEEAKRRRQTSMIISFDRHPCAVTRPDRVPEQLTPTCEKLDLISRQDDVNCCCLLRFDETMAALTAEEFMQYWLRDRLNVRTLLVGYDHHFGRPQGETFDDYVQMGRRLGIEVLQAQPFLVDDAPVSSSRIRRCLGAGNVAEAARLLGRTYGFTAKVIHGRGVGRSLGFPTANFDVSAFDRILPANGSYLVEVSEHGQNASQVLDSSPTLQSCFGMLYVGTRPTFDSDGKAERTAEVHLLECSEDLYGKTLEVRFLRRLREEKRFESSAALRQQLERDSEAARQMISEMQNH